MSRSLAALVVLALAATPLAAQVRARPGIREVAADGRQGFWLDVGLGAGRERVNLDGDGLGYSDPLWNPTVRLALGGTPNRNVRLGGEVFVWINDRNGLTETLSSFSAIGQFYPHRKSGFHLKGGLGLARSSVSDNYGNGIGDTGFGLTAGAGWEVRVGRKVWLTPRVDLYQQWYSPGSGTGYAEQVLNFGLGVTFQTR